MTVFSLAANKDCTMLVVFCWCIFT